MLVPSFLKAPSFFIATLSCLLIACTFPLVAQVNFNAAAAFSLRKIVTTYTGSAIQVRRSSDNTTQNIGFTSCGFLDTAALKTFVTGNSGYVSIWYDQSGNGRDASQATAASQPRIVNAGAVDYSNGRPTLVWPGASSSGIYLTYGTNFVMRTVNAVRDFKLNPFTASANNMQYLFSSNANADFSIRLSSGGTFSYDGDNNSNDWINGSGTPKLCWVNGTQTTTAQYPLHIVTASASNTVNGTFSMDTTFLNRNLFGNDALSELVVYSGTLTGTQRTLIETAEAVIYTLTISNGKYSPPSASAYNLFVNGIGRESSTDSVNATRSSVGMGLKCGTAATDFLKDNGDYVTCGINCPITSTLSANNLPATIVQRWDNDWYVNKTDVNGNNGNLTFYFDYKEYAVGSNSLGLAANYELLYRNSTASNFTIVPGTTKSVSGSKIMFTVDASNITTNYYYTVGTTNTTVSPLPIELSDFQCELDDKGHVLLNWVTASEFHNNYFAVERSTDGIHYQSLGTLKGAGTVETTRKYTFQDLSPLPNLSYYRLRQVDTDGKFKLYDPCVIQALGLTGISMSPNPADDYLELVSPGWNEMFLSTLSGKTVLHQQFSETLRLYTATLPEGIYVMKISQGTVLAYKKVVIRH